MSAPPLPRTVRAAILAVTPVAMIVAASTNYGKLDQLGKIIEFGNLSWTLPASVIAYEIVSTLVYFLTPRSYPALKRAAAVGAVIGLSMTMGLAGLYILVDDGIIPSDVVLRLALDPIPSLVTAAFLHMGVLAWRGADTEPAAAEAKPETGPVPEVLPEPEPEPVPEPEPPPAESADSETLIPIPDSWIGSTVQTEAPSLPADDLILSPLPFTTTPEAEPEETSETPETPEAEPATRTVAAEETRKVITETYRPLRKHKKGIRVARHHVERALEILEAERAAGRNPDLLKATPSVVAKFGGVGERTVRAALSEARQLLDVA